MSAEKKTSTTTYQKVTIEDQSELSNDEYLDDGMFTYTASSYSLDEITESSPNQNRTLGRDQSRARYLTPSPEYYGRDNMRGRRGSSHNNSLFRRHLTSERYFSRSRSRSSSIDGHSIRPRGRSRTRKPVHEGPEWKWRMAGGNLARDPSVRFGVHFHPPEQHLDVNKNVETSPYGSSSAATRVETLPAQVIAPFFCWQKNIASPDTPEQTLIDLLDQIDDLISREPVGKYYSKVPELTMDDVLTRQPSLSEIFLESDSNTLQEKPDQMRSFKFSPMDKFKPWLYRSYGQSQTMNKNGGGKGSDGDKGTDATREGYPEAEIELVGNSQSIKSDSYDPMTSSQTQSDPEEIYFGQLQSSSFISQNKTLVVQLVEVSQQIIWSFVPKTGGSVIHTLLKRFWGCVDIMCLVRDSRFFSQ